MYTSERVSTIEGPADPIELPTFLDGFRAIHRAMRRDSARLVLVAPRAGDRRVARRLDRWYDHFVVSIEHHHQREDQVVWPMLVDRDPTFLADTAALQQDHHVLDEALGAVSRALRDLVDGVVADPSQLVAASVRLRLHLDEHLDREEAAAFPRIARTFAAEDFHRLEKELRAGLPVSALAFEAPWVLHDLPVERQVAMIGGVPVVLRIMYYLAFRPRYRRVAAILGEVAR